MDSDICKPIHYVIRELPGNRSLEEMNLGTPFKINFGTAGHFRWCRSDFDAEVTPAEHRIPGLRIPDLLLCPEYGCQRNDFRQMMQMDPPMAKFTKNDGIVSLMHCQECIFHTLSTIYLF